MKTVRLVVRGVVQGVGFRHFVVTAAGKHGVHGWVRNLEDGAVEIVAQHASDEFLAEVRRGPRWARIDAVEREEIDLPALGEFGARF